MDPDRSKLLRQAYVRGAKMVAENARKWWSIPSDDSGHSLDDWLKAIEEWAAGSMYAEMPLFPGGAADIAVLDNLHESCRNLFPGLPCSELTRNFPGPGKFRLRFWAGDGGPFNRHATMMVEVPFRDSEFIDMDREAAISLVRARMLSFTLRAQMGEAVFDA